METSNVGSQPSPDEARDALAAAHAEEDATRNRPVPAWFFPTLAGILFVLLAQNAIAAPSGAVSVVVAVLAVVLAITVGGLVGRFTFTQPGYRNIRVEWGPTIASGLVALAFPVSAFLLEGVLGSWVWIAAGAALALLLLTLGTAYRRRHHRG